MIGAGEPALPGIALGHNDNIGFGFTIVNIDQMDLFVETLNPANPNQYRYKGEWRDMRVEHEALHVKGKPDENLTLQYTVHGPVLYTDAKANQAFALQWVGAEPGAAGYLAGLRLARANNWTEFRDAARYFKVPSENLVYADRQGNIGWIAAGEAPIRPHHNGVLPVPGESGMYDWNGYLTIDQHPQQYNPAQGLDRHGESQYPAARLPVLSGFELLAAIPLPTHRGGAGDAAETHGGELARAAAGHHQRRRAAVCGSSCEVAFELYGTCRGNGRGTRQMGWRTAG